MDALYLAIGGGRRLLQRAKCTTLGLRFPEIPERGEKEGYGFDLYHGAAGVGIALLDLFRATSDPSYAHLAREVSHDLIESTPHRPFLHPGLYTGHAGVALFHAAAAWILQDPLCLKEAMRLADELAETPFQGTDLLSGAAGTGLFFLSFHQAVPERRYLDAARRALHYLKETAEQDGRGLRWAPLGPGWGTVEQRYSAYTGLAHGAAGICLFLSEMYRAVRDPLAERLVHAALHWLDSKAVPCGGRVNWPVSLTDSKLRYHWCHGSTGIAQAYLAVYRATGRPQALDSAVDAGRAAWALLGECVQEPLYHCHGLAGIVELFLDLEAHGAGAEWGHLAASSFPRFLSCTQPGEGETDFGLAGASLATGTAGIVRVLLRLAGRSNLPILSPFGSALNLPPLGPQQGMVPSAPEPGLDPSAKRDRILAKRPRRLRDNCRNEWLPRVGRKLRDHELWVDLDPPDRGYVDGFLSDPRGKSFLRTLERVERAAGRLERRHREILCPGVLRDIALHTPFLREMAGTCLHQFDGEPKASQAVESLTKQYVTMLDLLLLRLSRDLRGPLDGEVSGRLKKMEVLSSDPHRNGQRVMALVFEDGRELIYKSRGVALERYLVGASRDGEPPSLAEMVNPWLHPAIPGAGLATHRIVEGGLHHGYAERVREDLGPVAHLALEEGNGSSPHPASLPLLATRLAEAEAPRFWYSAGRLAGFAVALGLRDLHSENLVCGGSASTPRRALHLVDLEMAFQEVDCLNDTILVDLIPVEHPKLYAAGVHKHPGLDHEERLCACAHDSWFFCSSEGRLCIHPGFRSVRDLRLPHLVQNPDDSLGYGTHLCELLRGMVDVWEVLQEHSKEIATFLRHHLMGAPARVLLKGTGEYLLWLRRARAWGYPLDGASWNFEYSVARPLSGEELRQLESCDIPYFFNYLGQTHGPLAGIRWFPHGPKGAEQLADVDDPFPPHEPFWSILERQTRMEVLARSLADAAAFVVPPGPFHFRNDGLGVRVFRPQEGQQFWIVALLERGRLSCRVDGEGAVALWLD